MKRILISLPFFIISVFAFSQNFGGFSNRIEWRQIQTPSTRIIFPVGAEIQAQKVANQIEYLRLIKSSSQDFSIRPVDIVLNNEGVASNGYVSSMPYHSMLYLTPPQDANLLGSQDWLMGLTTHEYQHIWQYNQMRGYPGSFFYGLMGDKGWGGYIHLMFPDWYFEGDAVLNETALSSAGRGRLPYFSVTSKAQTLDSISFSYAKVRNGSYKDLLPDYYEYGYQMLAYGQKKFGKEGWLRVVKNASNMKGLFYPFSYSLKKECGLNVESFYDSMKVDYKRYLDEFEQSRSVSQSQSIVSVAKTPAFYYHSQFVSDSTLLVMKSSYKDVLAIYKLNLNTGEEKKIVDVGYLDAPYFTYANGYIVWAESKTDSRWYNKEYSVLKKYDIRTGSIEDLTYQTRLFSPSFSKDASQLLVVEIDKSSHTTVELFDLSTRKLNTFYGMQSFCDSVYVSTPVFTGKKNDFVFVGKLKSRLALFEYNSTLDSVMQLTEYSANVITSPLVKGDKVYYSASYGQHDDIYCVNRTSREISRVSSSRVGAYFPSISDSVLVYSNAVSSGFDLQKLGLDTIKQVAVLPAEPVDQDYYCKEVFENAEDISDSIPQNEFLVTDFDKAGNAINIHSWGPTLSSNEYMGVELYSDNVLNNFSALAGYYYDISEELPYLQTVMTYAGWYPLFYGGYLYSDGGTFSISQSKIGLGLPFDFSNARFQKSIAIQGGYLGMRYSDADGNWYFGGLEGTLAVSIYKKMAYQQVAPNLGFSLQFLAKHGTLADAYEVDENLLLSELYLPGLFKTHAISVEYAAKNQTFDGFFFDGMNYVRGYNRPSFAFKTYNMEAIGYKMPLCYPDFGVNGFFFLKRIRMNAFWDFGQAKDFYNQKTNYASFGGEFYFDINWFNQYEVPVFVRCSFLNQPYTGVQWEFGSAVISF